MAGTPTTGPFRSDRGGTLPRVPGKWRPQRPRRVCVAIGDASVRSRVCRALNGVGEVLEVAGLEDVGSLERLPDERVVVVVGSRTERGAITPDVLKAFRRRDTLANVVLCLTSDDPLKRRVAAFAAAGADRFVWLVGPDQDAQLREDVSQRLEHALPPMLTTSIPRERWSRPAVVESWCARNAYRPLHVDSPLISGEGHGSTIAAHFCINRKTVYLRAARLGWKNAEELIDARPVCFTWRSFWTRRLLPRAGLRGGSGSRAEPRYTIS